jgi:phosphoglycerate kinase
VSDKIGVLHSLIEKVDTLLVGGAMAFTFLKANGYEVGTSRCENAMLDVAHGIMAKAADRHVNLWLPVDVIMAKQAALDAEVRVCRIEEMPEDWMGLDIGPATVALFSQVVRNAGTVVWNGPLGLFEFPAFSNGTMSLVQAIANTRALTIIGGGDTVAAAHKAGVSGKISYISTGGGAFLTLLEGKTLPGVAALEVCSRNKMIKKKEPPRRKSSSCGKL